MNFARRTCYYKPKQKPADKTLLARMEQTCLDFPNYGYRRVTAQLKRESWRINHKKVPRIMRGNGGLCRPQKKKLVCTTDSNHRLPVYPNLIKGLKLDGINQLWVADITFIHILVCFIYIYLAVVLDICSRKAIGYAISCKIDTQLTLAALRMAIVKRNPPRGCIHHSDRDVQYASADYVKATDFYGFQISMSRKGNPYDNAYAECFMKTLKSEKVHLWEYRTMEDVPKRIPHFIEDVYNHKRLHPAIGYRPPCEFEMMLESTPKPGQDALTGLI